MNLFIQWLSQLNQGENYEKIWRKNHKLKKDQPSTLFVDPVKSGSWAA